MADYQKLWSFEFYWKKYGNVLKNLKFYNFDLLRKKLLFFEKKKLWFSRKHYETGKNYDTIPKTMYFWLLWKKTMTL